MYDVAVLGGGMAGAAAALAARRAGATVLLVRRGVGATALGSGALDLVDTLAPGGRPLPTVEALRRLLEERPRHPLARVAAGDPERVLALYREALALLADALPLAGDPADGTPLVTVQGTWHPGGVHLAHHSLGPRAGLDGARPHVVTLDLTPEFLPERIMAAFDTGLPRLGVRPAAPTSCSLGEVMRLGVPPMAPPAVVATLFDDPAFAAAFTAGVADRVRRFKPTHVLFPPLLGRTRGRENLAALEQALGARCAEALALPPSLPGARLQAALDAALAGAGVERREGAASAEPGGSEGICLSVAGRAGAGADEVRARAVVLATGKFTGGGLARNGRMRETVFDLPLAVDGEPLPARSLERFLERDPAARQPLLAAGVRADADLRVLDADGRPARAGLFAAGALLDGTDYGADLGGLGLALLTGCVAGRSAAREAGR